MDLERQRRLDEVAAIAVQVEAETGVPAAAIVSQWALESSWGAKPVGRANYFGIKKAARHGRCCTVTTREVINGVTVLQGLNFADYASLEESCRDYAWLISHGDPYRKAWSKYEVEWDTRSLIAGIARVYATDPAYAKLATTIASQGNVQRAIQEARA